MTNDPAWQRLDAALRDAAADGTLPALWWRDDDAVASTPALDRLLALRRDLDMPLALAAIPAGLQPSLAHRLAGEPDVAILVHGLSHANHAPAGTKKAEFGPGRSPEALERDATRALLILQASIGLSVLPVFVPPWNRIAPDVAARLPTLGYRGLSVVPRTARPVPDLIEASVHVDPVDWHGTRSALPPERVVARTVEMLSRIRTGDLAGPLGFLTHHLMHDEAIWELSRRWLLAWRRAGAATPAARAVFRLTPN